MTLHKFSKGRGGLRRKLVSAVNWKKKGLSGVGTGYDWCPRTCSSVYDPPWGGLGEYVCWLVLDDKGR